MRNGKVKIIKPATTSHQVTENIRAYRRLRKTDRFKTWQRLQFLRQGGLCAYCETFLWTTRQNVEHILPQSKGGDSRFMNLVIACHDCNRKKGSSLMSLNKRRQTKWFSKKHKGTYTKNRRFYDNVYAPWTDEAIFERLAQL